MLGFQGASTLGLYNANNAYFTDPLSAISSQGTYHADNDVTLITANALPAADASIANWPAEMEDEGRGRKTQTIVQS